MARRIPQRKREPDAPDLPENLSTPPDGFSSGCRWDGVAAGADIDVADLVADAELLETRWVGAQLHGRRLTGLRARDVEFVRCDLSSAVIADADLRRVAFIECRLTGLVLSGSELLDVRIVGGKADMASVRMSKATNVAVTGCSLRGADFHEFVGENAAFLDCDLDQASFDQCRLPGLRLHRSSLEDIRGVLALRGARISAEQLAPLGVAVLGALNIVVTDE